VAVNVKLKLERFNMFQWFMNLFNRDCHANQTQIDVVAAHIKYHGSISTTEARAIGIKHLRSVICKMNKAGYKIKNVGKQGKCGIYKF